MTKVEIVQYVFLSIVRLGGGNIAFAWADRAENNPDYPGPVKWRVFQLANGSLLETHTEPSAPKWKLASFIADMDEVDEIESVFVQTSKKQPLDSARWAKLVSYHLRKIGWLYKEDEFAEDVIHEASESSRSYNPENDYEKLV